MNPLLDFLENQTRVPNSMIRILRVDIGNRHIDHARAFAMEVVGLGYSKTIDVEAWEVPDPKLLSTGD